jgi:DNA replicative helicase MCM subunit Mcm2 (Cdc46/Mcm family)
LSEEVSQEDVEEAIRLTHSSKASLFEDNARGAAGTGGGSGGYMEDAISAIFGIIRDHAIQSKNGHVSFMQVGAIVSYHLGNI